MPPPPAECNIRLLDSPEIWIEKLIYCFGFFGFLAALLFWYFLKNPRNGHNGSEQNIAKKPRDGENLSRMLRERPNSRVSEVPLRHGD